MTARVSVTVSEPVTRDISADDVRAYLVARGWARGASGDVWADYVSPADEWVSVPVLAGARDLPKRLAECIADIAHAEKRPPADVLRDMAATVPQRMRPAVPCPPNAERYRGEGNPHPARVDVRDATEGAIGIGDVACPVPGCKGGFGLPCTAVQP